MMSPFDFDVCETVSLVIFWSQSLFRRGCCIFQLSFFSSLPFIITELLGFVYFYINSCLPELTVYGLDFSITDACDVFSTCFRLSLLLSAKFVLHFETQSLYGFMSCCLLLSLDFSLSLFPRPFSLSFNETSSWLRIIFQFLAIRRVAFHTLAFCMGADQRSCFFTFSFFFSSKLLFTLLSLYIPLTLHEVYSSKPCSCGCVIGAQPEAKTMRGSPLFQQPDSALLCIFRYEALFSLSPILRLSSSLFFLISAFFLLWIFFFSLSTLLSEPLSSDHSVHTATAAAV